MCGKYTIFADGLENFPAVEDEMEADRSVILYDGCLKLFFKLRAEERKNTEWILISPSSLAD